MASQKDTKKDTKENDITMPQNYQDYQKRAAERAQRAAQTGESRTFQKVGFLKLKHDGDVALVRINVSKPEELMLADYHQLDASTKFMKVECTGAGCPFCAEAEKQAAAYIRRVCALMCSSDLLLFLRLKQEYSYQC